MDRSLFTYEVSHSDNLISFHCLQDVDEIRLKDNLTACFHEEPNAYGFDWLLDFSPVSQALSAANIKDIGRAWQRMAKGRDVGKRTAYITLDPLMRERVLIPSASLPYRTIRAFERLDEAHTWLRTLRDDDRGVQPI